MKWASTVSEEAQLEDAAIAAARDIREQLQENKPDLVIVFVSEHHRMGYERVSDVIFNELDPHILIGCSAGGVIGGGCEVEHRPGFSITAAVLPQVTLTPFHFESMDLPDFAAKKNAWEDLVGITARERPHFILLPDPFTFDAEKLLRGLDKAFPNSTKVGGLASGGGAPGSNVLYLNKETHRSGLVGVALSGNIEVDTIVAQGCRPIGSPMFVTKFNENVIQELDGRAALDMLNELYEALDAKDRELFHHSLFLGIVMNEHQQNYIQGDFLIRNLIGMDEEKGSLSVGTLIKENLVVQFHLRDAETSSQDLEAVLKRYKDESSRSRPLGSLLFSCLGRGTFLYGEADHDTNIFKQQLGNLPLGGFFCNGEIGPVHGQTFLHGYTSSFGIFKPRE